MGVGTSYINDNKKGNPECHHSEQLPFDFLLNLLNKTTFCFPIQMYTNSFSYLSLYH